MQLPRHPETRSSNNLEPLRMDFEFLDTSPLSTYSPSEIARQLDYQFIHSRWKNHRCNGFYRRKPALGENLISASVSNPTNLTRADFHPRFIRIVTYVRDCFSISGIRARADTFSLRTQKIIDDGKLRCDTGSGFE